LSATPRTAPSRAGADPGFLISEGAD